MHIVLHYAKPGYSMINTVCCTVVKSLLVVSKLWATCSCFLYKTTRCTVAVNNLAQVVQEAAAIGLKFEQLLNNSSATSKVQVAYHVTTVWLVPCNQPAWVRESTTVYYLILLRTTLYTVTCRILFSSCHGLQILLFGCFGY